MDGVNGFVSGYNFLILLTLYLINQQTTGTYYYYDFVFVIFVFYFINTIGKCFLEITEHIYCQYWFHFL